MRDADLELPELAELSERALDDVSGGEGCVVDPHGG